MSIQVSGISNLQSWTLILTGVGSFNASDTVQICVGEDNTQEIFVAHKSVLTRSAYFSKMLNGEWLEARTGIINLPGDNPNTINLYLQLIYTDKFPTSSGVQEIYDEDGLDYREFRDICDVYVLAEKLQDQETKKRLIV